MNNILKLLSILFLLVSCHHRTRKDDELRISHEPIDTIRGRLPNTQATPAIFEAAFIKGSAQKVNKYDLYFYGITVGLLKVTSGHIVACDPTLMEEYGKPFAQLFPRGEFPIQLAIAQLDEDEGIAYARIKFSEEPVTSWKMALLAGQSLPAVSDEEAVGYIVDGGMGCFIDQEANKALDKTKVSDLGSDLSKEMDKHYHHTWRYAIYPFATYNMAAFSAGFGEGRYTTYIGFDANGQPCRLLTDFGFVNWKN